MIVFGGRQGGAADPDRFFNDVWILDLSTSTPQWTRLQPSGSAPAPRWLHAAGYDEVSNTMVVFGGMGGAFSPCLNDVWLLRNANGKGSEPPSWTKLSVSAGPGPRAAMVSGTAYGRLIVAGGTDCASWPYRDAWLLQDYATSSPPRWTNPVVGGTALPGSLRLTGASVFDQTTDRTVIWGGPPSSMPLNQILILRGMFGSTPDWFFATTPNAPQAQANFGKPGIFNPDNHRFVFFGGMTPGSNEIQNTTGTSDQTWRLDANDQYFNNASWTRVTTSSSPPGRTGHTAVFDQALDRMVIFGGAATTGTTTTTFDDVWVLSGATTGIDNAAVRLTPSSLSFGGVQVGTTSPVQTATLENLSTSTVSVQSIVISPGFEQSNTCPPALLPTQMCVINVVFKPQASGTVNGELTVAHSASAAPLRSSLSGIGICPSGSCSSLTAAFTIDGNTNAVPYLAATGKPLSFVATDQTVGATYEWSYGDGTSGTGRTTTHTYAREGNYTAELVVRTSSQTVTGSRTLLVTRQKPKRRSVRHPTPAPPDTSRARIRAATGGTVGTRTGSISIGPGTLDGDRSVLVTGLSAMPAAPPSGLLAPVGPALSIRFSPPATSESPGPPTVPAGSIVMTLDLTGFTGSLIAGAVPLLEIRGEDETAFVAPRGSVNVSSRVATMTLDASFLEIFGEIIDEDEDVTVIAGLVNWSASAFAMTRDVLADGDLGLRWWNRGFDLWDALPQDFRSTGGRTCLVVHGVHSSVEKAFPQRSPAGFASCIKDIADANKCDEVVGFNYLWTQKVADSGTQLAAAIDALYAAGVRNLVLEGHSLGGVVSLAAASRIQSPVNLEAVVTLGSPIMGTPAAATVEKLITGLANWKSVYFPNLSGYVSNLAGFVNEWPIKGDLVPGSPVLEDVRKKFTEKRPNTPLIVAAGTKTCSSTRISEYLFGVFGNDPDDCIVGYSSASAQGFERTSPPPIRLGPFYVEHTELECAFEVIQAVGQKMPAQSSISVTPVSFAYTATEGGPNPANRNLTITNSGPSGSTLIYDLESTATWLRTAGPIRAPLTSGQSNQHEVLVDLAGLTANGASARTYEASLIVKEVGTALTKSVPVTLNVQPRAVSEKPVASVRFTQASRRTANILLDYSDAQSDARQYEVQSSAYAIYRNPAGDRTSATSTAEDIGPVANSAAGSELIRAWTIGDEQIVFARQHGDTAITNVIVARATVVDAKGNRSDVVEREYRYDVSLSAVLVTVSPSVTQVQPGATRQFTATVTGTTNTAVTWTTNAGTISSSGVLTATMTPGEYFVKATSVADSTAFTFATVTVSSSGPPPGSVNIAVRGSGSMTNSDGEAHTVQVDLEFRGIRFTDGQSSGRYDFDPNGPLNYGTVHGSISASFTCNPCPVGVQKSTSRTFNGEQVFGVTDTSKGRGFVGNDRTQSTFIGIWLSGGSSLSTVDSIQLIYQTQPNLSVYDYTRLGGPYSPYGGSVVSSTSNFTVTITAN